MLIVLVETFGSELKIRRKDIGDYLRASNFDIQSPSLPFKNVEPKTCLIIVSEKQAPNTDDKIYLGYWIGNADVPSVPIIFVGEEECVPTEIRRCMKNLLCVKKKNIESVLKPLIAAFANSRSILETAMESKVDTRIKLREKLLAETIKAMEAQGYNIEEYKERL